LNEPVSAESTVEEDSTDFAETHLGDGVEEAGRNLQAFGVDDLWHQRELRQRHR